MEKTLTDIVMVIDRSTSMHGLIDSTIQGYNKFIQEQRETDGDAKVTLILFDNDSEMVYEDMPIDEVPLLDRETYFVQGSTAMNDAVAFAITGAKNRISSLPENKKPTDVIFAIITDGMENVSKEFKGREGTIKIKEMIENCKTENEWQFVFLAANIDVPKVAETYAMGGTSNLSYNATVSGSLKMYDSLSKATTRYRSMKNSGIGVATLNFADLDD